MLNFLSETCETCKVRPEVSLLKKSPWLLQDFLNILNFLHDFCRFSFTFPKKTQSSRFSRYLWALCKTGITEPSHYFAIIVRAHLIWIVELQTLGYFFVSWHMIWGILTEFPWIAQVPEHLVNKYTLIQRRPWHQNMVLPDVKCGPVGFGLHYISCLPPHDLQYLGPFSPNLPVAQILKKQV